MDWIKRAFPAFAIVFAIGGANAAVTGVSILVGSDDQGSHPFNDNVWSVNNFPADLTNGIGWIVNPSFPPVGPSDFSRHDHVYLDAYQPDPVRAAVVYTFDAPTIVGGIRVVQHANGVDQIMGESGNAGTFVSLGTSNSPSGIDHIQFAEYAVVDFNFGNSTFAGTSFRMTVTNTINPGGWALYRAFPLDALGQVIGVAAAVPEPETYAILLAGLGIVGFMARRRGRQSEM